MMLQNKTAVIYGAGGSLGGAVARAFAAAGASVYVTGHHLPAVRHTADDIIVAGGMAEAAEVNARNAEAVNRHLDMVIQKAGKIDISFNLIGVQSTQDIPFTAMSLDDFVRPVNIAMETQFITATAAARQMQQQRSGVILSLTATPGGIGYPHTGGFGPACCAMECFSQNLASEVGPHGVRVVNIRSAGSPDSKVFKDAIASSKEGVPAFLQKLKADTMLKELPLMADIANIAIFLSSSMASKITGVTIDATCGTTAALNYSIIPIPLVG